jgi:outer membrane protein assembly factor BamE
MILVRLIYGGVISGCQLSLTRQKIRSCCSHKPIPILKNLLVYRVVKFCWHHKKNLMQPIRLFILFLLFLTIAGCACAYKQDVQQGNLITDDQIACLHTGMTKEEVRYYLGTPVLSHVLNQERWDYIYTCQKGNGPMNVNTRFSLYFSGERLVGFRRC